MTQQNKPEDSGPAFPSHGTMGEVCHEGMTLWDYFAAHALSNMKFELKVCAGSKDVNEYHKGFDFKHFVQHYVETACEIADAMITELSRRLAEKAEKGVTCWKCRC